MDADVIFWRRPEGDVVLVPARVAAAMPGREATDAEVGASHRAAVLSPRTGGEPKRRRPCPRCPKAEPVADVRWLGVRWIGTPWPLRLRLRWPVYVAAAPGCGCIATLKRWTESRRLRRFARRR